MSLKNDMISDLDNMLNTDEFAVPATYSPEKYAEQHPSNKSCGINGIFDHDFVMINGAESFSPVFDCATRNICGVLHGAKLTIHESIKRLKTDITYTVRGVQPNGTGLTRLILEAPVNG